MQARHSGLDGMVAYTPCQCSLALAAVQPSPACCVRERPRYPSAGCFLPSVCAHAHHSLTSCARYSINLPISDRDLLVLERRCARRKDYPFPQHTALYPRAMFEIASTAFSFTPSHTSSFLGYIKAGLGLSWDEEEVRGSTGMADVVFNQVSDACFFATGD